MTVSVRCVALSLLAFPLPVQAASTQSCVTMVFNPDSSVVLNGLPVDLASLPQRLAVIAKRDPRPRLCLVAGPQASAAEVQAALRVIQSSGLAVNMNGVQAAN